MSGLLLNLCSGQRPFQKPWINVDLQPKWNPDIVADCTSLPMIEDGSAAVVVIHHGAEHLTVEKADTLFKECHRMLAKGGSLLIFLPDLRALAKRWLVGGITDYIYIVNLMGAYIEDEADRHKWHYTPESLKEKLENCGAWSRIGHFDWRKIEGSDLARDWWILGMEAVK